MAHFYASVSGARNSVATKTGTKDSGIHAHVRGWNEGVSVSGYQTQGKENHFSIDITGGSNNDSVIKHLGIFKVVKGKVVKVD